MALAYDTKFQTAYRDSINQSINQYSFNKSMAERKLINNREKRHAKYMLYQKCQYNEMFR